MSPQRICCWLNSYFQIYKWTIIGLVLWLHPQVLPAQAVYEGRLVHHKVNFYNIKECETYEHTIDSTKTQLSAMDTMLAIDFKSCSTWGSFTGKLVFHVPLDPILAKFDSVGLLGYYPTELPMSATITGTGGIDSVSSGLEYSLWATNWAAVLRDTMLCPENHVFYNELVEYPRSFEIAATVHCVANRFANWWWPESWVYQGNELYLFDAGLYIHFNLDLTLYRFFGYRNAYDVSILSTYRFVRRDTMMIVGIWQDVPIYSQTGLFTAAKDKYRVTFDDHVATVVQVNPDSLVVRVPPDLVGDRSNAKQQPSSVSRNVELVVTVEDSPGIFVELVRMTVLFIPPRFLLYDEVTRATPPLVQATLIGPGPRWRQAFAFIGNEIDGTAAVRLLNTSTELVPLSLMGKVISPPDPPIYPDGELFDKAEDPTIGNLLNLGIGNAGIQFPVDLNGIYLIVVEADNINSEGPFPCNFQIHLAGNVGLPRKLIEGVAEPVRAIRLDTYFNHPAPRPETLANAAPALGEFAETALFKFANPVSTSQFAIAVLIPPTADPLGFPLGVAPVRAAPPIFPGMLANYAIDPSVPTATTTGAADPVPGTEVDFTQVPIPASVDGPGPPPGVTAILGNNDGNGIELPLTTLDGSNITSLITDIGSGNEIFDGAGADLRIIALSGSYEVAVSNTPFTDTFVPLGSGNAQTDFDLAGSGLTSARYVRVSVPSASANIDAVQSLHFLVDEVNPTIGPLADVAAATITMRRQKSPITPLDPMLELIGCDGSFLAENESAFGDDTDPDRSDAALINVPLHQQGFYRYLGRGYDTQPDGQSFGSFFTRLETGGTYDPVDLQVSSNEEKQTLPQKYGQISQSRQRDSYLFQATPGTTVSITVRASSSNPVLDPLIELYDPEDFLIAANDNAPERGKNAALTVTLPIAGHAGGTLPSPSTYRIVVMGIDGETGSPIPVSNGVAHLRQANGGSYELRVFTGGLSAVSAPPDADLPKEYALHENYPNPFNAETIIEFELPRAVTVELTVFNQQGQKVVSLVRGQRNAGYHKVNWNGKNETGRAVASGIYLYRLDAGGFVVTQKMLLLR